MFRNTVFDATPMSGLALAVLIALSGCGAAGTPSASATSDELARGPSEETASPPDEGTPDERTCDTRIELEGPPEEADVWAVLQTETAPSEDTGALVARFVGGVRGPAFFEAEGTVARGDAGRLGPAYYGGPGVDLGDSAWTTNLFLAGARMSAQRGGRARILWVVPISWVSEGAEVLSELERGECPRARNPRPWVCRGCFPRNFDSGAPECVKRVTFACDPRTSCYDQVPCDAECCWLETPTAPEPQREVGS